LLERGRLARPANLNLKRWESLKVAVVGVGLMLIPLGIFTDRWVLLLAAIVLWAAVVASNHGLIRWFARERGPLFALGVVPLNLWYYLISCVAVASGLVLYLIHGRPRTRSPSALTPRKVSAVGVASRSTKGGN
jgi:hypothetical protein